MQTREHRISNGAGWLLSVVQTWDEARLVRSQNPVVVVPGYGVNSLIFSYHPRGLSIARFLAEAGFEVWRADLRAQGASLRVGGSLEYGVADLALTDLGAVIDAVLARTQTEASRADLVGASFGGTLALIHAALQPGHRIGAIVAMGSPVRWIKAHPLLRLACWSPALVGLLPVTQNRKIAEALLPVITRHTPWLIRAYMNTRITDTGALKGLLEAVESPCRRMNREIATWIRERDLHVKGRNVSEALRSITRPLLCVTGNLDGLVPRETAAFAYHEVSSEQKELLEVGTPEVSMGHADLFVSNEVHARVLQPIAAWLCRVGQEAAVAPGHEARVRSGGSR